MLWVAISIATRVALHELHQRLEDVIGGVRIEISGRLVGEQHPRRIGDRARDGDALLLAAGQFGGPVRDALAETEIAQNFRRALDGLGALQPADHLRQHDVFERGEFRQQTVRLVDEADVGAPDLRCARRRTAAMSARRAT